jgi:hypothetical protein
MQTPAYIRKWRAHALIPKLHKEGKLMQKSAIRAVVTLAIFFLAASQTAIAQSTVQFPVERDAGMLGWDNHDGYGDPPIFDSSFETEEWSNHGLMTAIRGKKTTQHAAIMDWDTDAISAFINANVDTSQSMSWTFNIYPLDAPTDDIQIETLESLNDWVEGDGGFFDYGNGTSFSNFNWPEGTVAATTNFAQTAFFNDDGAQLDEDNSLPWVDNDFGTDGIDDNQYSILGRPDNYTNGLRIPDHINSELLTAIDLGDAAFDFTFASVPLDDELIAELLGDPDNRGIILGNDSAGGNWQFATRDGDGEPGTEPFDPALRPGPLAPFLELTYTPGGNPTPACDFDDNGVCDTVDIDLLGTEIIAGTNDTAFDLNGDTVVDLADQDMWRGIAATENGFAESYLNGDADLDGSVVAGDLNALGTNWQSSPDGPWSHGDFDANGFVDAGDLNLLGLNWQGSIAAAASAASVPEPSTLFSALMLIVGVAVWGSRRRRVFVN